jgi:hypothetical protein
MPATQWNNPEGSRQLRTRHIQNLKSHLTQGINKRRTGTLQNAKNNLSCDLSKTAAKSSALLI